MELPEMNQIVEENNEEQLSPIAQKVHKKMRNLLIGSLLVMFLGIIAVFSVIVYRIIEQSNPPNGPGSLASKIAIDSGANVKSVQIAEDKLYVLVDDQSGTYLLLFDAKSGTLLSRTDFVEK